MLWKSDWRTDMYYRHMLYVMAKEEAAWLKTTFYFLPISLYLSIERKVPYFFLRAPLHLLLP